MLAACGAALVKHDSRNPPIEPIALLHRLIKVQDGIRDTGFNVSLTGAANQDGTV